MSLYLGFCDESGNYLKNHTSKAIDHSPFFVTSTVIINAVDWKFLKNRVNYLKQKYNIPVEQEVKYNHLYEAYKAHKSGKTDKLVKDKEYLKVIEYKNLIEYFKDVLSFLLDSRLSHSSVICNITDNNSSNGLEEETILKWHLQNTMQRFNMELSAIKQDSNDYGILFVDTKGENKDNTLRKAYDNLFKNGDFMSYDYLMDGLNIQISHHSVGIQLADLVAGVTLGWLRSFPTSVELFETFIFPKLRRDLKSDKVLGYGLVLIPKRWSANFARKMDDKIKKCKVRQEEIQDNQKNSSF